VALLKRISTVAATLLAVLYTGEIICACCSAALISKGASMMPATLKEEEIAVTQWFNRYSNSYAAGFVFESMSLIFILSLFACGYTITVREFKSIQSSLNSAAKKDSKISAKAHILEQGVQDMTDILSHTTAIVFAAFLIQTCYDILWTTATFGDVFKTGCKHQHM
jgi:hypothetical protein